MQEPMAKHTSFRIGGPVEVMAFPKSREELSLLLKTSALLDCTPVILGAGTNVLAPDEGMSGLVICLKDCLDGMETNFSQQEKHIRPVSLLLISITLNQLMIHGDILLVTESFWLLSIY